MREWVLSEVQYGYVKEHPYEVAVLPMGATEPHNLHLPYGTDTYQVQAVSERACELAWKQGARVVVLPSIPYGTETNMREFPLAMNVMPSTLLAVIRELLDSLARANVRKVVIVNGHGGNDFKPLLRELFGHQGIALFLCDWFKVLSTAEQQEIFSMRDDHAGEVETSLMLHLRPDLVSRDEATGKLHADDGATARPRFDAVNRGWVSITRPWHLLTTNSGSGNPHAATAEKGKKLTDILAERLGGFLVELAASKMDDQFPF